MAAVSGTSSLLLLVFLTPVCGLQRHLDANVPIRNIRVDPQQERVTWDLSGNVTQIMCFTQSLQPTKAKSNNTYCQFYALPLCKTTNYTIKVTHGPPFSTLIQYPKPDDGEPGAAVTNLSCWIHDVDFLECSWAVGRDAPQDVQYHLYLLEPRAYEERECLQYTTDAQGLRTGCRFHDISRLKNVHYHFLVNGTSAGCRIPCTETFATLSNIEILSPPNLTGRCNQSHSVMEWSLSSYFTWDFVYELHMQKGSPPTRTDTVTVRGQRSYELVNPGTYTARVRARNNVGPPVNRWSAWSAPLRFECEKHGSAGAWPTAVCIALGSLLSVWLAGLLCRRFSVIHKVFPPIPWVKDPVRDFFTDDRLVTWETGPASWLDCPVETVRAVAETGAPMDGTGEAGRLPPLLSPGQQGGVHGAPNTL